MIADINECRTRNARCDPNANCFNTPGSYNCICKEGFQGDGMNCVMNEPPST